VTNLEKEQFTHLQKTFDEEELLRRKGFFPYDWFNSLSKFEDTQLPPKEEFYSKLNDSDISPEDFKHAQKVWDRFKMKRFLEYHDLYLLTDVVLLADVFENFRDVCLKNYEIDPCWYYSAPGLAWDACLKKTEVQLELLSDPDMLLIIEQGICGGVSMISKRYAKANNKYMKDFNSKEKSKFIQRLDANNLYGWAMGQPLPVSDFKWMKEKDLDNWEEFPCILEANLEYPKELHDLHNDYPLAQRGLL